MKQQLPPVILTAPLAMGCSLIAEDNKTEPASTYVGGAIGNTTVIGAFGTGMRHGRIHYRFCPEVSVLD